MCTCLPAHPLSQFQDFLKSFGPGSNNGRKVSQLFWDSSTFHCFSHSSALPLFKPLGLRQSVFQLLSNLGSKLTGDFLTLSSCIFFTCTLIPKCGFTISVLKKCNAVCYMQYNGNYRNYYGSVPVLKSQESESVLGLHGNVLVAGGLQGWLLWEAARSFPYIR